MAEEGERSRQSEAFSVPDSPGKIVERSDLGVFELLAVSAKITLLSSAYPLTPSYYTG